MAAAAWIQAERAECRRPIKVEEVPHLERLGAELRRVRKAAGLSRPDLAVRSELSERQIQRIEHGSRRTRRGTLERIASGLVDGRSFYGGVARLAGCLAVGPVDDLVERLVCLAGPALSPDSAHQGRIDKRRASRWREAEQQAVLEINAWLSMQLDVELALEAAEERRAWRRERARAEASR